MIFVMCFTEAYGQRDCSFEPPENMPTNAPPNFSPNQNKCIRIKFHFLNNTSNPRENISPQFFVDILTQLNKDFGQYNISFTPDNICPHLGPENLQTQVTTHNQIVSIFAGGNPPPPEFEHESNVMNLYFFQQDITPSSAAFGNYAYVRRSQLIDLTHEVGHFLGLRHTFDNAYETQIINGIPTRVEVYECKDRNHVNNQNEKTCLLRGDRLCDTGADPREYLGLIFNSANCTSLNLPNPDRCDDHTTPWDVPVKNWMSYYIECTQEFSADQNALMHFNLENNLSHFTVPCNSNDPECDDIIISTSEVWPNNQYSNLVRLCQNQKIIITPTGSLSLNGVTLTKKLNSNQGCPELAGNWKGIYIEGGNGISYPGGPSTPSGGSFTATAGSIVEFSINGIQAEKGHLGISLSNCIMRENPLAINAGGPGGLVYGGSINIINSTLSNSTIAAEFNLIKADGCNVNISGSTLTNISASDVTGIKAYNNRVSIKSGTTIQGFQYGIDKEMSGNLAGLMGLNIENSKFLDGINSTHTSIRNRGGSITAKRNWFGGEINVLGKCTGNWYGNNFREQVILENPALTQKFSENNFFGPGYLILNRDQSLTDATCNIWTQSNGDAVFGKISNIKSEWGTKPISSGNKSEPVSSRPSMGSSGNSNQITHYYSLFGGTIPFSHDGITFIEDQATNNNINCIYNVFPTSLTGGGYVDSITYNEIENHLLWHYFNNSYEALLVQLSNAPADSLASIISQLENSQVGMQLAVLNALDHSADLSIDSYNIWLSRANHIYTHYGQMITLFANEQFSQLIIYLNSLELSGDESTDRNNMVNALNWFYNAILESKNIYKLNNSDINHLIELATSSFGNYTTILRSFLNMHYNIRLDPPMELNQYNQRNNKSITIAKIVYSIVPNPVTDCFKIISLSNEKKTLNVKLFDIHGKLFGQWKDLSPEICISPKVCPGVYVLQVLDQSTSDLSCLKIIIE